MEKLDDLFFLINIQNFDSKTKFSKNYKTNLSQIVNIKYLLDVLINSDNNINNNDINLSNNSLQSLISSSFPINQNENENLNKGLLPLSKFRNNNK